MVPNMDYKGSHRGLILKNIDPNGEQVYIQKYPYLNGPNFELNRLLLRKTRQNWSFTTIPSGIDVQVTNLEPPLYGLDSAFIKQRNELPDSNPLAWHPAFRAYGWKVNLLPDNGQEVLSIGCGTAIEIGAMRCLGKGKKIHAVDFRQGFTDQVQELYDFSFECDHWLKVVQKYPSRFDAAFSNHCMEHVYNDPTEALTQISSCLKPNGVYVFAMPIEMSRSNPYSSWYPLLHKPWMYPLMLDAVDCGHPWKADLPEIKWRLNQAGFKKVEFFFRKGGIPYEHVPSDPLFDRAFDESWKVSQLENGGEQKKERFRDWCRECVYRIKSRLKINILKNESTNEVLVRATK
jgi:SAM-dependent methyltransferase